MNRFESRGRLRKLRFISLPLLAFILLFILFLRGVSSVSDTTYEKQEESLHTAIERSVVQCYAVEGTYPPSLTYLEDHYGLTYDHDLFFIDYQAYGSNIFPDITILRK